MDQLTSITSDSGLSDDQENTDSSDGDGDVEISHQCFTIPVGKNDMQPCRVIGTVVIGKQQNLTGKKLIKDILNIGYLRGQLHRALQEDKALFLHSSIEHRTVRIGWQQLDMNLLIPLGIETQEEFDRLTTLNGKTHRQVVVNLLAVANKKTIDYNGPARYLDWGKGERRRMVKMLTDLKAFHPVIYFMMFVPDKLYHLLVIAPRDMVTTLTYRTMEKLLDVQHYFPYIGVCMVINGQKHPVTGEILDHYRIKADDKDEIIWRKIFTDETQDGTWEKPYQIVLEDFWSFTMSNC